MAAQALDNFKRIRLAPHQLKALGLPKNWASLVPKQTAERVAELAAKHEGVLKKLENYLV